MKSGIIFIHKPAGITSFQALGVIKKKLGHKKTGHTGTLDKFASGLIVVLAGSHTRLNSFFTNMDKTYTARIVFGTSTDTLDPEGTITGYSEVPDYDTIEKAVLSFRGIQEQVPPDFSAVHVNGERAYKRKLAGEKLEIPPREINILSIKVISWEKPDLIIRVHCSKGTYIRSLARDIGARSGAACHVGSLKRVKVGDYSIDSAVSPEDFNPETDLVTGRKVFEYLPDIRTIDINSSKVNDIRNGVPFKTGFADYDFNQDSDGLYSMFDCEDFIGILKKCGSNFTYGFIVGSQS